MTFVKIPGKDFEMQDAPVTQREWEEVMGRNPSSFKGRPDNPVEQVSFNDIMEFLAKLNEKNDGYTYMLPLEEEWAFCAKPCDEQEILDIAWFYENSNEPTQPVRLKKPNSYGLYDMLGNVWEWTKTLEGSDRVLCGGGCWYNDASHLRSGHRGNWGPGRRGSGVGFRLVRRLNTEHSNPITLDSRIAQAVEKMQKALDELKKIAEEQ